MNSGTKVRRAVAALTLTALAVVGMPTMASAVGDALPTGAAERAAVASGTAATEKIARPRITRQPKKTTVAAGKRATFSVKAKGSSLRYQWQVKKPGKRWVNVKGAKKASLKLTAKTGHNGQAFRVVVTNASGKKTSTSARLTVVTKPRLTRQPTHITAEPGAKATFTVAAQGGSLTYRWYTKAPNGTWKITAGRNATYAVAASTTSHGTQYRVLVENKAGKTWSSTAVLKVPSAPRITGQPVAAVATSGDTVAFGVTASGSDLRYQWQARAFDSTTWVAVAGANKAAFTRSVRTKDNLTDYRVVVSNALGTATSTEATLFVDSTYADPAALGAILVLHDWALTVTETLRSADYLVLAENMFNDPAPAGSEYVLGHSVGCYGGDTSSTPWLDLQYGFIGSDGRTYEFANAVLPSSLYDVGDVYPDGCVSFIVGSVVPSHVVDGGVWVVTESTYYPSIKGFIRAF